MVYDPFNRNSERLEDKASSVRVEELMTFLATRKEPQTKHLATVSALLQFKASASDRIQALEAQLDTLEAQLDNYQMRDAEFSGEEVRRRQPKVMQLPEGARSVEVKF